MLSVARLPGETPPSSLSLMVSGRTISIQAIRASDAACQARSSAVFLMLSEMLRAFHKGDY